MIQDIGVLDDPCLKRVIVRMLPLTVLEDDLTDPIHLLRFAEFTQ